MWRPFAWTLLLDPVFPEIKILGKGLVIQALLEFFFRIRWDFGPRLVESIAQIKQDRGCDPACQQQRESCRKQNCLTVTSFRGRLLFFLCALDDLQLFDFQQ